MSKIIWRTMTESDWEIVPTNVCPECGSDNTFVEREGMRVSPTHITKTYWYIICFDCDASWIKRSSVINTITKQER